MPQPPIFPPYVRSQKRRIRETKYQSGKTDINWSPQVPAGLGIRGYLFIVIWWEGICDGCICETLLCKCSNQCSADGKPAVFCPVTIMVYVYFAVKCWDGWHSYRYASGDCFVVLGRANVIKTVLTNRTFISEKTHWVLFLRPLKWSLFIFSDAQLRVLFSLVCIYHCQR
jgi:hypothetical protein